MLFNELHEKSWANSPVWLGMTSNTKNLLKKVNIELKQLV